MLGATFIHAFAFLPMEPWCSFRTLLNQVPTPNQIESVYVLGLQGMGKERPQTPHFYQLSTMLVIPDVSHLPLLAAD